ncbi:hypothetical protein SBADM41S_01063 [Streptomyces badius]
MPRGPADRATRASAATGRREPSARRTCTTAVDPSRDTTSAWPNVVVTVPVRIVQTLPTKSSRDGGGSAGNNRRKRSTRRRTPAQASSSDPASTATASTARVALSVPLWRSRSVPVRLPNQAKTISREMETETGTPPRPTGAVSTSASKES